MINAGDFNKQIDIMRHTTITDEAGFDTVSDVVVCSAWAKVNTTRGYKLISNGTNFEDATTSFVIRHPNVEIKRKDFVRFNGIDWSIEYLNNIDEQNTFVELQCKQVNNQNNGMGGE
jgi:SPP1 family predicted phage head-tail adaptor